MGARNFNSFGKSFKLFLMIDFLILILSFIGTAQFANECYQLMSFAGFAALVKLFIRLDIWDEMADEATALKSFDLNWLFVYSGV